MFIARLLKSSLFYWALDLFWVLAILRNIWAGDTVGMIVSALGLAATLLIVGAIKSRSRRGMYPNAHRST